MDHFTLGKKRKLVDSDSPEGSPEPSPENDDAEDPEPEIPDPLPTAEPTAAPSSSTGIVRATAVSPELDPRKRRKLQVIIRAYRNRFANRLEGVSFDGVETMSIEELQGVIDDCRFLMNCSSPGSITRFILTNGIKMWEYGTKHFGFKTDGLETMLYRNPEFTNLLDEVCLENAEITEMSATARMGFLIFNMTRVVHEMNSVGEIELPENNQNLPDFLRNRYRDL